MIKSMVDKDFLIWNWEMGISNFGLRISNFELKEEFVTSYAKGY